MRVPPSFTSSAVTLCSRPNSFTRCKKAGGKVVSRPTSSPIFSASVAMISSLSLVQEFKGHLLPDGPIMPGACPDIQEVGDVLLPEHLAHLAGRGETNIVGAYGEDDVLPADLGQIPVVAQVGHVFER